MLLSTRSMNHPIVRLAMPSVTGTDRVGAGAHRGENMVNEWFVAHDGLTGAARFPWRAQAQPRVSTAELLLLVVCGAAGAVAVNFVKLGLGIPGHSILLAALPMAFGLSLAPRHFAGSVMSAGALGTASMLTAFGASYGSGAIVSLSVLGPMMDLALRRARSGGLVYLALMLSGVAANLLALGSRAAFKILGRDPGSRPFDSWWLQAVATYTLSGVVAGLLGALCWFHFTERASGESMRS
jgi:hypothetical protein